jgi:hypothetical protein
MMEALSSSQTSVLQEPHGITSQTTPFFNKNTWQNSEIQFIISSHFWIIHITSQVGHGMKMLCSDVILNVMFWNSSTVQYSVSLVQRLLLLLISGSNCAGTSHLMMEQIHLTETLRSYLSEYWTMVKVPILVQHTFYNCFNYLFLY